MRWDTWGTRAPEASAAITENECDVQITFDAVRTRNACVSCIMVIFQGRDEEYLMGHHVLIRLCIASVLRKWRKIP